MSGVAGTEGRRLRVVWRDVTGIVLLDKLPGPSSNAVLQATRRLFRARKAGHTGSLDPLAGGLLPLCFGQATKISGMLLDADKTYRVTAQLGIATTTGDAEGEPLEPMPVPALSAGDLETALARFRGPIAQVPPMYSALKKDGRRLYELARKGIEVERAPRQVIIHALRWLALDEQQLTLEVRCSKGTYVRTLVEDIAQALGTAGHVVALRRTQLGPFRDDRMWSQAALEALMAEGGEAALDAVLLAPDLALPHWPAVRLGEAQQACVLQGQAVFVDGPAGQGVRMYGPSGLFLGVGRMTAEGCRLAPERIMLELETPRQA